MNFGEIQLQLGEYLNANHLSSMLPFFVKQGQVWLEKRLRPVALHAVQMVAPDTMPTLAQADTSWPVPTDYLLTVAASLLEGTTRYKPLDRKDYNELLAVMPSDTASQDRPTSFTRRGALFILDVPADTDYSVENIYCAKATDLVELKDTNYWTTDKEELLVLAALYKAIPYLGDDPRAEGWRISLREGLAEELEDARAEGMSGTQARFTPDALD